MRITQLFLAVVVIASFAGGAAASRVPGDVAPGAINGTYMPGLPLWAPQGDGVVDISDVVVLLRDAVGLHKIYLRPTDPRPTSPGDIAPGTLDRSTVPPTWHVEGDARVDVADVVVALQAATGSIQGSYSGDPAAVQLLLDDHENLLARLRDVVRDGVEAEIDRNRRNVSYVVHDGHCWAPGVGGSADPEPSPEYTTTNVQVDGVDEADFVKNDGSHVYVLAGGLLQVFDAWPAVQTHRIGCLPIDGIPQRMYVHGGKALVYASLDMLPDYRSWRNTTFHDDRRLFTDDRFQGDGRRTTMTLVDLSRPEAPRVEREIVLACSYLASRRIGDVVHTVAGAPQRVLPFSVADYWPPEFSSDWDCWRACAERPEPWTEEEIDLMFDGVRDRVRERVRTMTLEDLLPAVRDTRWIDGVPTTRTYLLSDLGDVHVGPKQGMAHLVSVLSLDMVLSGPLASTAIVSDPGAVHATADSLYLAVPKSSYLNPVGWFYPQWYGQFDATIVHSFRLAQGSTSVAYAGSGLVPGHVLSPFGMDEHEGSLRIVTHDPFEDSTVSVLSPAGGKLELSGICGGIARGETVRAVRFDGATGYVVTYVEETGDPLFVLDLSDPRAPKIRGELHIPGFSTYLHQLDAGHLLACGYDATDQGDITGVVLQVFDVSDFEHPSLLDREVVATGWTQAAAMDDYHAFNFYRSRDLLAFPVATCEQSGTGLYDTSFSGLVLYRVTVQGGIEEMGRVAHELTPDPAYDAVYGSCRRWWRTPESWVERSVFIGDVVYSIAPDRMKVSDLEFLRAPLADVDLLAACP